MKNLKNLKGAKEISKKELLIVVEDLALTIHVLKDMFVVALVYVSLVKTALSTLYMRESIKLSLIFHCAID